MDSDKCSALKTELEGQPEPHLVRVARFFDGNDDEASIGCNLVPHPGVARFRETLQRLHEREDVDAVYAWIAELDPGEDAWPFSDTVLVVGPIDAEALGAALSDLQPDDVDRVDRDELGDALPASAAALIAWWD